MPLSFDNTQTAFQYKSTKELIKSNILFALIANPLLTRLGTALTKWAIRWHLPVKSLIKYTIYEQFCGGETLEEADLTAQRLAQYHVHVIMDYGVEGKSNEDEFDKTTANFLKTIEFVAGKSYIPFISLKLTGLSSFELLEKLHRNEPMSIHEKEAFERVKNRLFTIVEKAVQCNIKILIDAEETWIQQPIDDLTYQLMAKYNSQKAMVYNTYQLYTTHRFSDLKHAHRDATQKGYILGAKLVRGAYMEKERERASTMNYSSPIHIDKSATDKDFDDAIAYCIDHLNDIHLFVGTHNEQSCLLTAQKMQERGVSADDERVHFSQLYGMSDNISFTLAKEGYNLSKYLPYGPVKDVVPYLLRRAQENTSVAGQTTRELFLLKKEIARRKKEKSS
jgi:Proline dehydrogenase.